MSRRWHWLRTQLFDLLSAFATAAMSPRLQSRHCVSSSLIVLSRVSLRCSSSVYFNFIVRLKTHGPDRDHYSRCGLIDKIARGQSVHQIQKGEIMGEKKTQTVEQTGKIWKLISLVGVVVVLYGVGILAGWWSDPIGNDGDGGLAVGGVLILFLGLVMLVVSRVFAWWFHG